MKKYIEFHRILLSGHPFSQLGDPIIYSSDCLDVNQEIIEPITEDLDSQICKIFKLKEIKTENKQLIGSFEDNNSNFVLAVDVTSPYGKTKITVMTIPVKIRKKSVKDKYFTIYPDTRILPLINPDLLECDGRVPPHCIGKAKNIERFNLSNFDLKETNLDSWIEVAQEMFDAVCDVPLKKLVNHIPLNLDKADIEVTLRAIKYDTSTNLHIINLYEYILSAHESVLEKTSISTIQTAYAPQDKRVSVTDDFLIKLLQTSKTPSLAHMDECCGEDTGDYSHRELFALDNTQRFVVNAAAHMNSGKVLAVNGPPGSGKTAMLKAVISHQYVEAAINQIQCPIIIGVGATNQSVTNIVNAFPNVLYTGEGKALLHMKRWICGPKNYGTYFPSESVKTSMSDELARVTVMGEIDSKNRGGVARWIDKSEDLHDRAKIDTLKKYFIRCAQDHFGLDLNDVESCVEQLHERLVLLAGEAKTLFKCLLDEFDKGFEKNPIYHPEFSKFFDKKRFNSAGAKHILDLYKLLHGSAEEKRDILKDLCREYIRDKAIKDENIISSLEELLPKAKVLLADRALDLLVRAELFHYAARYWEGKYILSCSESFLIDVTSSNLEAALRRMCMITPILVSTVQTAPKLFAYRKPEGMSTQPYLLGKADLLIIDEAGQADIRTALPLLALAKKAIAVGDIAQIPPVVKGVTPLQEQGLYQSLRMSIDNAHIQKLHLHAFENKMLPSLNGSILHVLRQASFCNFQGLGMTLRGHYRCQATLSQFCNELVYDNSIFIIPQLYKENGPFKPLSWVSSASATITAGDSHMNYKEAEMIVDWLTQQWPTIYDHYNKEGRKQKRLPDLVGIVSPYKKQSLVFLGREEDGNNNHRSNQGKLHALLNKWDDKYKITLDDIDKMKVGTVNALQGAEKPIILFSGTKSVKFGGDLHYRNLNYILNVALSRAKDCFVAFVCEETFRIPKNKDEVLPSIQQKSDSVSYLGYYLGAKGYRLFPRVAVIIESDYKIKKLQKILGQNYLILSTKGKVLSLSFGDEDALSIENGLFPHYQYSKRKDMNSQSDGGQIARDAVNNILKQCSNPDIDEIILATDDDFVGEHIAWHLSLLFKQHQPAQLSKIKRVRLRGLSDEAVLKAFKQKEDINMIRASAEMVRETLDLLLARKLSQLEKGVNPDDESEFMRFALQKRLVKDCAFQTGNGLGRVKAAILALAYEHLKKQIASIKEPTFAPVTITVNGKQVKGRLVQQRLNGETIPIDKTIENVRQFSAMPSNGALWEVIDTEFFEDFVPAPIASTLNVMRQNALRYGLSPIETYQALTSLYEGKY